jgi:hypothetical protein
MQLSMNRTAKPGLDGTSLNNAALSAPYKDVEAVTARRWTPLQKRGSDIGEIANFVKPSPRRGSQLLRRVGYGVNPCTAQFNPNA